jgi:hypothetical protein
MFNEKITRTVEDDLVSFLLTPTLISKEAIKEELHSNKSPLKT